MQGKAALKPPREWEGMGGKEGGGGPCFFDPRSEIQHQPHCLVQQGFILAGKKE